MDALSIAKIGRVRGLPSIEAEKRSRFGCHSGAIRMVGPALPDVLAPTTDVRARLVSLDFHRCSDPARAGMNSSIRASPERRPRCGGTMALPGGQGARPAMRPDSASALRAAPMHGDTQRRPLPGALRASARCRGAHKGGRRAVWARRICEEVELHYAPRGDARRPALPPRSWHRRSSPPPTPHPSPPSDGLPQRLHLKVAPSARVILASPTRKEKGKEQGGSPARHKGPQKRPDRSETRIPMDRHTPEHRPTLFRRCPSSAKS